MGSESLEVSDTSCYYGNYGAHYFKFGSYIDMVSAIKYDFSAEVWQHSGVGGWYFVSVPNSISREIRTMLRSEEEGWGRLKAIAVIGKSQWKTAIWFDTKRDEYLLPLKADIRKKETIEVGKIIGVSLLL